MEKLICCYQAFQLVGAGKAAVSGVKRARKREEEERQGWSSLKLGEKLITRD